MKLWRRLKNIWKMGEYKIVEEKLKKDFPTVKKRLATIVKEPINYFEDDTTDEQVRSN